MDCLGRASALTSARRASAKTAGDRAYASMTAAGATKTERKASCPMQW